MTPLSVMASVGWDVLDRFRIAGRLAISPHGAAIAVGYLAGSYVLIHEARKRGISEDQSGSMVFWALIGAIVGARAGYVFTHLSQFKNVGDVLAIYRGGISLIGGIFGAILFAYPLMRRYHLRFLQAMDTAAIGLPLGIVIGRIGDLIIGDHLGKPTSWLLAFQYRGGTLSGYTCAAGRCVTQLGDQIQSISSRGATLQSSTGALLGQGAGVHQTALYDFISTMVLVLVLVWMNRAHRRTGVLVLTFATWYAGMRIITDFLRIEDRFFGLTGSQWSSVAVAAASIITLVWFSLHPEDAARDEADHREESVDHRPDAAQPEEADADGAVQSPPPA